ncbi:MAG: alpha/beta hydrolase [Pseudomonadota bacterium]
MIVFIHGVPDTSFMWTPLIGALGLVDGDYLAPTMPGFNATPLGSFDATREAYVDWAATLLEEASAAHGPVDLVGHDWGAPIAAVAAQRRPETVRTWTLVNAAPEPSFEWHRMARIWQTPIIGELFMRVAVAGAFRKSLVANGMPPDIAAHEAPRIDTHMKSAILRLYRSAKDTSAWNLDFAGIADRGLILWGENDPYVPVQVAQTFSDRWSLPLRVEQGVGHWGICERPEAFAAHLKAHWHR